MCSSCHQNGKYGNFTLLFCRGRHGLVLKCVSHVQHDYFSSLDQSNSLFVALSLPFRSWMLKLPNDISFSHYRKEIFFSLKIVRDAEIDLFEATRLSCQYFHFSSCELENKQFLIMAVSSLGIGNCLQKQIYNACKEN